MTDDNFAAKETSTKLEAANLVGAGGKRRSSLLTRSRMSFYRSKGSRGADCNTLRGTSGADFEGEAIVTRSGGGAGCGCFVHGKVKHILIKGSSCFVFSNEKALSPDYAIQLAYKRPKVHASSLESTTVYLEETLGDVEYRFVFDTKNGSAKVKTFLTAAEEQAVIAERKIVQKRLGHDIQVQRTPSLKYAEIIAAKKVKDAPEAPVLVTDILQHIPMQC